MAPFRLEGRVALITGAATERGIGRAVARVLHAAGARVALADTWSAANEGSQSYQKEIGAWVTPVVTRAAISALPGQRAGDAGRDLPGPPCQ